MFPTETWKTALGRLIESAEERARAGARAFEDVRQRHTTAARGHQLQALIDELILEGEQLADDGKLRESARSPDLTSQVPRSRLHRLRLSAARMRHRLLRL